MGVGGVAAGSSAPAALSCCRLPVVLQAQPRACPTELHHWHCQPSAALQDPPACSTAHFKYKATKNSHPPALDLQADVGVKGGEEYEAGPVRRQPRLHCRQRGGDLATGGEGGCDGGSSDVEGGPKGCFEAQKAAARYQLQARTAHLRLQLSRPTQLPISTAPAGRHAPCGPPQGRGWLLCHQESPS